MPDIKIESRRISFKTKMALISIFMAIYLMGLSGSTMAASTSDGYKVDPGIVCMVTDKVMGKPQIPVDVGGKTYYGCCKNCVGKLKGNPSIRNAKDPVSGKIVDKSGAFIVEGAQGEAIYFESALTADNFIDSLNR